MKGLKTAIRINKGAISDAEGVRSNKRKKRTLIALLLIIFILMSFYVSTIQFNLEPKEKIDKKRKEAEQNVKDFFNTLRSASFQYSGLSISETMNLQDGQPYAFSGQFWNDADLEEAFTQGWLETGLIGDDRSWNDSISVPDNYNDEFPEVPENITFTNGSMGQDGDLTAQDSDEAWFNSSEAYHYPATYSFTDEVGETNTDIDFITTTTRSESIVIESFNSHRAVLQAITTTSGTWGSIVRSIGGNRKEGIVEFWWAQNQTNKRSYIAIYDGSHVDDVRIEFGNDGYFYVSKASTYYKTSFTYLANTLYHIKIAFNYTSGYWYCWINNNPVFVSGSTQISIYNGIIGNANYFRLGSQNLVCQYLDAVGYSWDSDYKGGDNFYWQNYQGTETFDNYDLSTNADYRGTYNFDYTTTQGYYYMGDQSEDFNNQEVGDVGIDNLWIDDDYGTGDCGDSAIIIDEFNGHKNVLKMEDNDASGLFNLQHELSQKRSNLVIEFWFAKSSITTTSSVYFLLVGDGAYKVYLLWYEDWLFYNNGTHSVSIKADYIVADIFSHYKLILDDTSDTFDVYINGTLEGNDLKMYSASTGIDKIFLQTSTVSTGYSAYFDAIGCPTDDPYYRTHLNTNPYDWRQLLFYDTMYGGEGYFSGAFGSEIQVVDWGDHNNVLRLYDNNSGLESYYYPYGYGSSTTQTSGVIEFWWSCTDNTKPIYNYIYDSGWTYAIMIILGTTGKIRAYNGAVVTDVCYVNNNQWYHIRIDFNTNTDKFDLYINGTKYCNQWDLRNAVNNIKFIRFNTGMVNIDHTHYLNAIDFSWSPDYETYRNTNPYYTDLTETGFTDDFTITYAPQTTAYINGFYNNHKKHLNLTDSSSTNRAEVSYSFSDTISGWIEMWVMSPPTDYNATINIEYSTGEYGAFIRFDVDDTLDIYDGGWINIMSITQSTWYRIKIYFNCVTDTYDLYVNDILKRAGNDFLFARTVLNKLIFKTDNSLSDYSFLVDSFGLSWENAMGTISNLTVIPTLNFTISIEFGALADILELEIYRYQYSTISIGITLYLYNWTSGLWVNVTMTQAIVGTAYTYTNTATLSDFLNSTNGILMRLYGYYNDGEFCLKVDRFQVRVWKKSLWTITKTFYQLGVWRYRFHLHSSSLGNVYTDWVYFDVVESSPNVGIISESPYTTKWDFMTTDYEEVTVFEESFDTTNYWSLYNVPNHILISKIQLSHDARVTSSLPTYNYYNLLDIGSSGGTHYGLLMMDPLDYLFYNITQDPDLTVNIYHGVAPINIEIWETTEFDEMTVTWNTQPDHTNYLRTEMGLPTYGSYTFSLGGTSYYYKLIGASGYVRFSTEENSNPNKRPHITYYLSKIYQTNGILAFQTNITETVSVRSPVQSLNLEENTQIEVWFNTTSSNKIEFNLLNGGSEVGSYTLSPQGNTNYGTRRVILSVDSDITMDQFEVSGILNNQENVIIQNVKVYYNNASAQSDTFYVGASSTKSIFIPYPYDYEVQVYEKSILKRYFYLTSSVSLQTLIFYRVVTVDCYINFYDSANEYLNFFKFKVYINYTYEEIEYTNVRMTDNIIKVDWDTEIAFLIYDSFDVLVKTYSITAQSFIDISLEVYSLKIKNEYDKSVDCNLIKGSVTKTFYLFSQEIIEYFIYSGSYTLEYLKEDKTEYETLDFTLSATQVIVINASKICFLTYANQKGQYLEFNNYKTYLNGTLLYYNIFYRDIGSILGLEIKDRYDISILNYTYTVLSNDNYIVITLTEYSLKVYNQQPYFNHINITRDPNYYKTSQYWSEWAAPGEIIDFRLFGGYYRINFTRAETADWYAYAYVLNGDDILVISSSNTIYNVLQNIQNVNTTIGNQITNVWIDLTNQNSNINTSIINVDITLTNLNSTLGTMLLYQNISLTNIESDIGTLFAYIGSEFVILGSNINSSFLDLESTVYLVNNTIYTAVNSLESNLLLINNTISGNITLMLAQNVYLTEILQKTLFSHLLNWSNVAYNISFLEEQIMLKKFINNYRDKTLELQIKYQNITEVLQLTAQNAKEQYLPKNNVSMRVYSVDDGVYLSEWHDWSDLSVEDGEIIDFGFYEELEVPIGAEVVDARLVDYILAFILLGIVIASLAGFVYYYHTKSEKQKRKVEVMNEYPNNQFNQITPFKRKLKI